MFVVYVLLDSFLWLLYQIITLNSICEKISSAKGVTVQPAPFVKPHFVLIVSTALQHTLKF